jgi:hypothetical protein
MESVKAPDAARMACYTESALKTLMTIGVLESLRMAPNSCPSQDATVVFKARAFEATSLKAAVMVAPLAMTLVASNAAGSNEASENCMVPDVDGRWL